MVFMFSFDFLDQNIEKAMIGFNNLISDPDFDDHSKISEALNITSAQIGNEMTEQAIKYAIDHVSSPFTVKKFSLLNQVREMCQIEVGLLSTLNVKSVLIKLTNDLVRTYFKIMNKNKIKFFTSTNQSLLAPINNQLNLLISNLKLQFEDFLVPETLFNNQYEILSNQNNLDKVQYLKSFIVIPSGVNYVTESLFINEKFGSQKCPVYHVIASLLSEVCLPQYTEQAVYQVSCHYCIFRSALTFYTFRDPNILKSFSMFEKGVHDLVEGIFNSDDIEKAKISLIRKIYQNEHPYNLNEFLHNISEELKGAYLQSIMLVTHEQIQHEAQFILQQMAQGNTSQVIMGAQTKALDQLVKRGWLIERSIDDISVRQEQYAQVSSTRYEVQEIIQ